MITTLLKYSLTILTILLIGVAPLAHADVEVFTANTPAGQSFKSRLTEALRNSDTPPSQTNERIVVTLGYQSYLEHRLQKDIVLIAAFISREQFKNLPPVSKNVYVIFSDPQAEKLNQAISKYLPNRTVGYLNQTSEILLEDLISDTSRYRPYRYIEGDLYGSFSNMYSSSPPNAFLVTENREIYNRDSILYVLESLYRNRIPVVSTNKALIGKGSLLTVYVSNEEILSSLIETIRKYRNKDPSLKTENFAEPTIVFDKNLAEKVGVVVGGDL